MPFKFKLSKRLALTKASLAAGAVLALACTSDLTDPQLHRNSAVAIAADLTPLAATAVVASAYQDPNVPQNTLDNNLGTRWSANGDGQWIRYDLGSTMTVGSVTIAWYQGTSWQSAFELQVSLDGTTWSPVFTGRSSGQTLASERYDVAAVPARYVRIVGHGQWNGTTLSSWWTSITEVAISASSTAPLSAAPVAALTASGYQDPNVPQNTRDGNLATRWSANGDGQWIRYDLGSTMTVGSITVAWYQGTSWQSAFELQVSLDGATWSPVFTGRSSGRTLQPERYDFAAVPARYVRIVGHGQWNSTTLSSWWNSITEVAVYATATGTGTPAPVATVSVSPASLSIAVGQTKQLTATPRDAAGHALTGRTVSWKTSNGAVATVSATGLVAGVSAGTATITATSEAVTGTATSTMTAPMAPVNPGTVTDLAVVGVADTGTTLAFTEVDDGTGQPASYDVRYAVGTLVWGPTAPSVTRGTCTTPLAGTAIGAKRTCTVLGLTPATAYQFRLVAFRGTLTVNAVFGGLSNVAGATTTGSLPGSGAPQPGPSDPIIFQDGFEGGDLSRWTQDPPAGRYSLSTDPARVHSGTRSLQVLFTPTNAYGMITRWFMPGYDEIYVKFNVLFEENFDERNGLHFLTVAGNRIDDSTSSWGKPAIVPNGTDYFYAGVDPEFISGDAPLKPLHFYTYWPDMTCCYGNRFYQTTPKTPLVAGRWQEVVMHIKLNTPGQYDGVQELWINGVKQISVQNLRWRTTTDLRLNEIRFDDYMSQGPTTEHLWIDDVTVWRP